MRVWDAATGGEIAAARAPDQIVAVAFAPSGDAIVALALGPALIWSVPSFAGTADDLGRIARCRSGWTVTAAGLEPTALDPGACHDATRGPAPAPAH